MVETVNLLRRDRAAKRKRRCPVCGSAETRRKLVTNPALGRTTAIRRCLSCGHVKVMKNFHDYTKTASISDLGRGLAPRFGTEDTPGREFAMANMAADVLGRGKLDVLVYGAGRSLDNRHIATLPKVRRVAIGDIMRVRDEPDFVDTSQPAKENFDIVIACEVIEHFTHPRKDFERLLGYVHRAGIVVCSTNIYDGSDLSRHNYIFGRGHVSYYTPEALRRIAKANRMHVDFRLPASSQGEAGPRKRYVIFSHSQEVMEAVSDYFGRTPYAPSEKSVTRSRPDRVVRPMPRAAAQAGTSPTGLG